MPKTTHFAVTGSVEFDPDDQPLVWCRQGFWRGSKAKLSSLTIAITADTRSDGSTRTHTYLNPVISDMVINPDDLPASKWADFQLHETDVPLAALDLHSELLWAVHKLLSDSRMCGTCQESRRAS